MESVLVLLSMVTACYCAYSGASYTECQSSSQCGSGRCCVVVYSRFPTTACENRRRVGEQCRPPSDKSYSTTLQFPGGASVYVTDVHQSVCPCEAGAACYRGTCIAASAAPPAGQAGPY